MHATKLHGFRSPYDRALHGTCCLACLRNFHSPDRLIQHYKERDERCGKLVLLHVAPADAAVVAAVRQASKDMAKARKAARLCPPPAVRVQGPLPLWAA